MSKFLEIFEQDAPPSAEQIHETTMQLEQKIQSEESAARVVQSTSGLLIGVVLAIGSIAAPTVATAAVFFFPGLILFLLGLLSTPDAGPLRIDQRQMTYLSLLDADTRMKFADLLDPEKADALSPEVRDLFCRLGDREITLYELDKAQEMQDEYVKTLKAPSVKHFRAVRDSLCGEVAS